MVVGGFSGLAGGNGSLFVKNKHSIEAVIPVRTVINSISTRMIKPILQSACVSNIFSCCEEIKDIYS